MRYYILMVYLAICGLSFGQNPQTEISNGILKACIYLPNAEKGYYRATRFDWSGVISSLEFKGHNYFGKWFDEYNPTAHYSIMGPVDAFDPLNYDETKSGETFVKIGVGLLTKIDDSPFNSSTTYPIADTGKWEITQEASSIQFNHVLKDDNNSYEYTKTINFVEGKPEMRISYQLKNTGNKLIETQVFNHNFFVFDDQYVGKGYELTFTKNIAGKFKSKGMRYIAGIKKNKLKIKRSLAKQSVYCGSLKTIDNNAIDYDFSIDNLNIGVGVRIKGNQHLSNLVFWSKGKTICPEPYISIKVKPGEVFSWETSYEFYVKDVHGK